MSVIDSFSGVDPRMIVNERIGFLSICIFIMYAGPCVLSVWILIYFESGDLGMHFLSFCFEGRVADNFDPPSRTACFTV